MTEPHPDYSDVTLAHRVLELAKTLTAKNSNFRLSLKIHGGLNIFLSSSEQGTPSTGNDRRRKSPSTLRRNEARKKEFLRKKRESPTSNPASVNSSTIEHNYVSDIIADNTMAEVTDTIKESELECNLFGCIAKSRKGLNGHKGGKHRTIPQVDGAVSPIIVKPPEPSIDDIDSGSSNDTMEDTTVENSCQKEMTQTSSVMNVKGVI